MTRLAHHSVQRHARSFSPRLSALLAIILCTLVTLTTRVWLAPSQFADNDVYVDVAGELRQASLADLFPLEPLSRGWIAFLSATLANPAEAIYVASWINSILFVCLLGGLAMRDGVTWRGLLITWGLYGALLAFVTLRATPAYLLVAMAVLWLRYRPWLSFATVIVASGFHISAIMALPPMLLQSHLNRLPEHQYTMTARRVGIAMLAGACVIYGSLGLWGQAVTDLLAAALGVHEALAKFLVYAQAAEGAQSPFHRAYFLGLVALLTVCLLNRKWVVFRHVPYACLSLAIMATLSPSPVVAFRQSLFWAAPLILTMPWHSLAPGPVATILLVLASAALYAIGLSGTLVA